MKKIMAILYFITFAALCFAKQETKDLDSVLGQVSRDISSKCEKKEIIAILDFRSETEDMSRYLNNQLISMIFENSTLQVVTRSNMDKVEKELKFQGSGLVSDSTALSIGERLGAHAIIFGSLEELDNKYNLQVRMLNVETASYSLFKKYEISRSSKTEQLLHHKARIYKSSLGFMAEINKNSVSAFSPAGGIVFDYSLTRRFSAGVKALASYDAFNTDQSIYSIETSFIAKLYVASPGGEPSSGLFVSGEIGPEFLMIDSKLKTVTSGGITLGFRIPSGSYYFEPYLRGGYPYLFGAGVSAGFRF